MQASAHFVAQAFFCQYGDQCKIDDHADGQDNRRPGNAVGTVEQMLDQQFQRYAESRNLHEDTQGAGQHRERKEAGQQRKDFRADRQHYDNGQPQLPEPCGRGGEEADQEQINGYRDAVGKQRDVNRRFAVKNCGKGKDKKADTAADHCQ